MSLFQSYKRKLIARIKRCVFILLTLIENTILRPVDYYQFPILNVFGVRVPFSKSKKTEITLMGVGSSVFFEDCNLIKLFSALQDCAKNPIPVRMFSIAGWGWRLKYEKEYFSIVTSSPLSTRFRLSRTDLENVLAYFDEALEKTDRKIYLA